MLADLSVQHEKMKEITEEVNTDLTEMSKHKTYKSQAYVTMDDVNYALNTKEPNQISSLANQKKSISSPEMQN